MSAQRDRWYHGLQSPTNDAPTENLDIYGTLLEKHVVLEPEVLQQMLSEGHMLTRLNLKGLTEAQLIAPIGASYNPLCWGVGHVSYFYETNAYKLLKPNAKQVYLDIDLDLFFDSIRVSHDDRWKLDYDTVKSFNYSDAVRNALSEFLEEKKQNSIKLTAAETYLITFSIIHEHWHLEDFIQTRQTLAFKAPPTRNIGNLHVCDVWGGVSTVKKPDFSIDGVKKRVYVPPGTFYLGAKKSDKWVFDSEKWEHPVRTEAFYISTTCVTNQEFSEFLEAGGYANKKYWSYEGWIVHSKTKLKAPYNWKKTDQWYIRVFDEWKSLHELSEHPVIHVSFFEAEAYCKFKGCRLPTEAEWKVAAGCSPNKSGSYDQDFRIYPWGNELPTFDRCNSGCLNEYTVPVTKYAHKNVSGFKCIQMLGNCHEWTSTTFLPFPGFVVDYPYRENSVWWFGTRKVVLGGAFATGTVLLRNSYRNFYPPDFNKVFIGFRVVWDAPKARL